jgi:hypothetical protein
MSHYGNVHVAYYGTTTQRDRCERLFEEFFEGMDYDFIGALAKQST